MRSVSLEKVEQAPASRGSRRSAVDPRWVVGEGASQSLALTACTRARARHSITLLPGTRASFRHARSRPVALARHPLAPPNRRMPRCTMTSVPATTLATADEVELRKVTQRSTIGASSRSSPQAVLFTRQAAPNHVIGASQQGQPRGGGRRMPREGDRFALQFGRLRPPTALSASHDLRHHASSCSRCSGPPASLVGRLEQRAAPQHERQHGQLLVRLRRG